MTLSRASPHQKTRKKGQHELQAILRSHPAPDEQNTREDICETITHRLGVYQTTIISLATCLSFPLRQGKIQQPTKQYTQSPERALRPPAPSCRLQRNNPIPDPVIPPACSALPPRLRTVLTSSCTNSSTTATRASSSPTAPGPCLSSTKADESSPSPSPAAPRITDPDTAAPAAGLVFVGAGA